ncbi:MAG TPA: HD domain-containing protein [Candidatus Paceibacterota bacterium]|nr:HD domain-containing protein [Candidatus Paceibacterota bacterium]
MSTFLKLSDAEVLRVVEQLRIGYKLKVTPRYGTYRDVSVHSESVGEHIFALSYLARYFVRVEQLPRRLNMERVDDLSTFHDFGEIPQGDKPYKFKTKEDEEQEKRDAVSVFAQLPPEISDFARECWEEYNAKETPEAQFVNALDKVEPCFELYGPYETTLRKLGYTYHDHVDKKLKATEHFPVMRRFVEATVNDKLKRGVFAEGLS